MSSKADRKRLPPLPDHMRAARPADHAAIDALLRAAFPTPAEAALVQELRRAGAMQMELVLPDDSGLAGYLALSEMTAPEGWLCLAPLAIAPGWQGRGLGSRLTKAALKLTAIKRQTVVVLGDPAFYTACGFSSPRAARLTSPYPVAHTLIAGPGDDIPVTTLIYPTAFATL